MGRLFGGLGWLAFFIGIAVMVRGCGTDFDRPTIGPNGWLYSTGDTKEAM